MISAAPSRLKTKGPFSLRSPSPSFFSGPNFNELLQRDSSQKALWSPPSVPPVLPRHAAAQGQGLEDKGRADGHRDLEPGRPVQQGTLRKTHNLSDKWSPYRGSESKLALS